MVPLLQNMINNVLLLGGTGAMGVHLANILSTNGVQVYITSRKVRTDSDNIFFIKGNAKNLFFLTEVIKSHVWNCIVDFMTYSTADFQKVIDLLLANTKQYIYLSSSRVYSDIGNLITEDTPRLLDVCTDLKYLATDEYALYKAREEDILHKSKWKNYTIVRPYITYSEIRLPLGVLEKEIWISRVLKGKSIVIQKEVLNKITSLAYGEDVALVIANLIDKPCVMGETYNITTNENTTWGHILEIYLDSLEKILGRRPKVCFCETFCFSPLRMLKNWFKDIIHLGSYNFTNDDYSINYQLKFDRMFNRAFDNKKTDTIIKIEYNKVDDKLGECTRNFVANPIYNNSNWPLQFIFDRIANEKTCFKDIPSFSLKFQYILIRFIIPYKYIVKN